MVRIAESDDPENLSRESSELARSAGAERTAVYLVPRAEGIKPGDLHGGRSRDRLGRSLSLAGNEHGVGEVEIRVAGDGDVLLQVEIPEAGQQIDRAGRQAITIEN